MTDGPDTGSGPDGAPNVVFILCDQMRRQAMGAAGDPNVSTPNLDALAADGVRFTAANATYPICVPARFSLLTGEHGHTRFAHNGWRMSPAERTLADALGDAGYHTAHVGKWHLANWGHDRVPPEPYRGGFDHWQGFEVCNAPFETDWYSPEHPAGTRIEGYQTDGLTDLAIEYLDDRADAGDPFFLTLSVEPPHPPFTAPEAALADWTDRELEFRANVPFGEGDPPEKHVPPDGVAPYGSWGDRHAATDDLFERHNYHGEVFSDEVRAYYAMVENLDRNLGRLLSALEARDLREDTVVVFTADHGEMLGSHGLMMKQHPYEESVGVPLVVAGPGIDAGRTVDVPVCSEDLFPTLLGLADADPGGTPGADLGPLLTGGRTDLDRAGVLLEFVHEGRPAMPYSGETWRAFRTERYKYTVRGGEPWQLFDLETDPYEQDNRIEDPEYREEAARLHGHLRAALFEYADDYALAPAFGHEGLYSG